MNVLVSIVTKRNLHAELVKWLVKTKSVRSSVGIDIVNTPVPLEIARNIQVGRFIESGADVLFIVDSDCVPPPESIELIENFDLPFLSIPHPTVKFNPETGQDETGLMVMWKVKDGYSQVNHLPLKGLMECDAVGCSGIAVKREVLLKMKPPYFKFVLSAAGDMVYQGEDFYFCDKVKKSGYRIFAWCDTFQTHYIEISL